VGDDDTTVIEPVERAERGAIEQLGGKLHDDAVAPVAVEAAQGGGVAAHLRVGLVGTTAVLAVDRQHGELPVGDHGRSTRLSLDQAELAERLAGLQPRQLHDAAVGLGAKHAHAAGDNDVELAAQLALLANDRAVSE